MVHATSEALGLRPMTEDYHDGLDPWLYVDASVAIGVAQRTGLGKIRHLDTASLWLQRAIKNSKVGILKVLGTEKLVDLMTKFTDLWDHEAAGAERASCGGAQDCKASANGQPER